MDAIGELLQKSAIVDLIHRYATAIDTKDWPLLQSCFLDDCELDYGQTGRWSSSKAVTEHMSRSHDDYLYTQHRITNAVVRLRGDAATACSYVHAMFVPAADPDRPVHAYGYYDDEMVRHGEDWRIAKRTFTRAYVNSWRHAARADGAGDFGS